MASHDTNILGSPKTCVYSICVSMACCAQEGLGASSKNRKQEAGRWVGRQLSWHQGRACVHDSLNHRWMVGHVGTQTACLSHSRLLAALHLYLAGLELVSGTSDLFSHKACGAQHLSLLWVLTLTSTEVRNDPILQFQRGLESDLNNWTLQRRVFWCWARHFLCVMQATPVTLPSEIWYQNRLGAGRWSTFPSYHEWRGKQTCRLISACSHGAHGLGDIWKFI